MREKTESEKEEIKNEKELRLLLITFHVLAILAIAAFAFTLGAKIGAGYAVQHIGHVKEISSHYYLIVREGDTLYNIAQKLGGTNWEEIVNVSERNRSLLKNPEQLQVGMLIEIPSSWIKLD